MKSGLKNTEKYRRIQTSIAEVGVIEPLMVYPHTGKRGRNGQYFLLDGHLRYEVLRDLGRKETFCLVSPYGNSGNDWLDINLRRAQSPEERPSTNTSIGLVQVSDMKEILVQKTDRSGFIEDEGFSEMRSFAKDALEWMAVRRLEVAEKRRSRARKAAPKRSSKAKKAVQNAIEKAPSKAQNNLKTAFSSYEKSRDRQVSDLMNEIQLYRTLSTAGITTSTFAHESSGNPIKVISQSISAIERRAKKELGGRYSKLLGKPVLGILRSLKSLAVLGTATLKLLDHEKRRNSKLDLHSIVKEVLDTFGPFLEGRDVELDVRFCQGKPYLRGRQAAVESIVTNLLNNAVAAFEAGGTTDRLVRITTELEGEVWRLKVQDNGPGIKDIKLRDIWLPGRSTRKNGTGLGLTIVKDAASDMGGSVAANENGELGGAEMIVELPIFGA